MVLTGLVADGSFVLLVNQSPTHLVLSGGSVLEDA